MCRAEQEAAPEPAAEPQQQRQREHEREPQRQPRQQLPRARRSIQREGQLQRHARYTMLQYVSYK